MIDDTVRLILNVLRRQCHAGFICLHDTSMLHPTIDIISQTQYRMYWTGLVQMIDDTYTHELVHRWLPSLCRVLDVIRSRSWLIDQWDIIRTVLFDQAWPHAHEHKSRCASRMWYNRRRTISNKYRTERYTHTHTRTSLLLSEQWIARTKLFVTIMSIVCCWSLFDKTLLCVLYRSD
jgi:hypothetical protein